MNDPHSWYPFSAFKFFLIIFRIHFTKELSAIIMIKNELGGRPVRLKVNWCQKSAKALCRKHYGVHLFCQRDTKRRDRQSLSLLLAPRPLPAARGGRCCGRLKASRCFSAGSLFSAQLRESASLLFAMMGLNADEFTEF